MYNTLSNEEIIDLDVGALSDAGFCFLWVINSQFEFGFECLRKWGYTYVDSVTWVKKTVNDKIAIAPGWYILHSSEVCLVGVKANGKELEFNSRINDDIIYGEIREKSRKPDAIYELIERMVPGGRKIELFARNHNLRKGWLGVGNQLGEYYDWGKDVINCNDCEEEIKTNEIRWKSRTLEDTDYCNACFVKKGLNKEDFFEIENIITEMVFHQYYACDGCNVNPLWGLRFHCLECTDCDLCELCFDAKVEPDTLPKHESTHRFSVIETPDLAGGLPVHRGVRCQGCFTLPIVGYRFHCFECAKMDLCTHTLSPFYVL
eukprot:TRINITY_DN1815_c0_g1_i2.p1 TRINITY_DN1815_c0_g1~~TRINITY_DN1815_c0_g1_i2.p1  ORF type:complete len:318 (+),score=43.10 TRINITY_DN1815_c0_g1_i2:1-954(+)